ncbi:TAXI family TRAP transporter solute-binding subunit [Nostoc sp. WHI]|uniref:TAXI family TRAP transporter solute-binding subunit n=1 Tax=Nostoc sp. WHI TaxID=2650611 RepID=UPI0018C53622|nr:TAXI family TRAP transporter solute-binding subunit [Nostoc sp. WHI]MBG1265562.1 TAXI family TRAP transporter solute-binding subunit [Nostoc sp. WHI]
MTTSKNIAKSNFLSSFPNDDPLSKIVFLSLGLISIGLVAAIIWNLINRLTAPQLTLAAGNKTGESYIISEAIKEVVERRSNIKIIVEATDGTTRNLEMLEEGKAQLAAAQADVATQEMDMLANSKAKLANPQAKTVAVLYQDLFQLVVRDPKIEQFVQLKGKIIAIPASGGQYNSFLKVAAHYGLSENDFKITGLDSSGKPIANYDDQNADIDFRNQRADAVFRVRASGNKSIFDHVKNNQGRLLPILQGQAMKIKYPTLITAIIPQGAYRGNPPMPTTDLPTVAVPRLLLASDKVDARVIQEFTRIIYEYRREIANAIAKDHAEIKPLIASINRPNTTDNISISLHPGAFAFYERDKPSFIQENADYVALLLTFILLIVEWFRQFKLWIERSRKNEADEYLQSTLKLMNDSQTNLDDRQKQLDDTFKKAAEALVAEKISQESFRTFNEAYKTTREAIERDRQLAQEAIEQKQREVSAKYIKAVVKLLQDSQLNQHLIQQELDKILAQVANDLVRENISQESFRTFVDAYKTTRDKIVNKS